MKKKSPIVAVLMAALLVTVMPLSVLADVEADVSLGNVSIGDTKVTHTTSDRGTVSDDHGGGVTVKQSDPSTSNTISVTTTDNNVIVTLNNVNIDTSSSGGAAMSVNRGEGTTVTVELNGENSLKSGANAAGLQTSGAGNLVIQDSNHDGSLTATGDGGAGIGGGYRGAGSNITISGGTVEATGGYGGAGIGGVTTMPRAVMEALAECGVTLVIHWMGGEDIVIDKPITNGNIWVFSFYTLPQLLAK